MIDLELILRDLCGAVPEAIGAVLCDFEGERVVSVLGAAEPPAEAVARAKEHVPRALALSMPLGEFLIRLAAAEPCALLGLFGAAARTHRAGPVASLTLQHQRVELQVFRLPDDFYLCLVLRRPVVSALARRHGEHAARRLAPALE